MINPVRSASATGWDFSVGEFRQGGERIYNLARAYNVREGLRRDHDSLPARLSNDPLPDGPARGMTIDNQTIEMLKDAYYELRGWDITSGIPTQNKLRQLALEKVIKDLW